MDLGIIGSIALLAAWAAGTWLAEPPGWYHGLLTAGVFLLIWSIVRRDARRGDARRSSARGTADTAGKR